jgi:hypothetical protein
MVDRRRSAVLALAGAGVLVGHWLAYLVAHPAPQERLLALADHGYLEIVSALAVPASLVALVSLAIRHARLADDAPLPVWWRLAALQAALFLLQEVSEAAAGDGLTSCLHEPAIPLGILLQLPIALALLGLVRLSSRAVLAWDRAPAPPRLRPAPVLVPVAVSAGRPAAALRFAIHRRGPPHRSSIVHH